MDARTISADRKIRRHAERKRPVDLKRRVDFKTPACKWRSWYWMIGVLIVDAAFETYSPALRGPFVYDDFSLPFYNPYFPVGNLIAWISGVRPLLMFSYWANFQLS